MAELIVSIAIILVSVIIHEVSHGYAAFFLGDKTAAYAGRLSMNPLRHLDPIGSILIPLVTYRFGFMFGWAKPVPVNPYNLRYGRKGEMIVAAAGPAANLILVLIFASIFRILLAMGNPFGNVFVDILSAVVILNLSLAIFNLIPIPPLDGSKILWGFLPIRFEKWRLFMEQFSFIPVIIFILLFSDALGGMISSVYRVVMGI